MEQKAQTDGSLNQANIPVGEILRRTRMHYGQSLHDIERALRIRSIQIEAIETGQFDKLPGRVYAIGFVRSYAEYLGLDGERMVAMFKAQMGGKSKNPVLDFPIGAEDSKAPQGWLVAVSIVMALAVVMLWWYWQGKSRPQAMEIPPVAERMARAGPERPTADAPPAAAGGQEISGPIPPTAAAAGVPAMGAGIILNIKQNSWVEIKDSQGKEVVSRVLKVGDKYFVPDRPDLFMSLGNAGGVEISVEGQALQPLGGVGEVQRNIPLDTKFLKTKFSRKAE